MNSELEESADAHKDVITDTIRISIDGEAVNAAEGELLVEAILREKEISHICYHSPLMGTIQTCDTCMVEVDGKLVRSCGTRVTADMKVVTESKRAKDAGSEAFDFILGNHMLYCTVCDNNNENCRVHNTAMALKVQHQEHPFKPKQYEVDMSNPFYRYDPSQCILCGQCVQACQTVQVNETLSIGWELDHPRVLWDGGQQIDGSSCVSCGHCITVCPCNALMEKSMLGEVGFMTRMLKTALDKMIDVVKTGSHADKATNTPAYKETAVRLKLLLEQGTNPLKPLNFRFPGKPTPQNGVEVERKWKRSDYRMPGTQALVQIEVGK